MVVSGASAYEPRRMFLGRRAFDDIGKLEGDPVWTFHRFGRTVTQLPCGRLVMIGGEHEDYYHPDFCIYNDVGIFTPGQGAEDGSIEILGYPRSVFPPTDFHSATFV